MNTSVSLSHAGRPATSVVEAIDEHGSAVATSIAEEHPLTIYLDKRELVTLMTLGAAPEELTIGYLRNQRIVAAVEQLASVQVDWETESVAVTSRQHQDTGIGIWDGQADEALERRLGQRTVTTGCGQGTVFGNLMDDIDRVRLPDDTRLHDRTLYAVMERVRKHESIYKVAGAVHGCALCANDDGDAGRILRFVEDVGRHNAVDAIAGWMWLSGTAGADKIFYTTGRLTSEMVIKCAQMGIPFLVSRSGVTRMGYDIAERLGMTMVGRCQGRHYLLFTGKHRFLRGPVAAPGDAPPELTR